MKLPWTKLVGPRWPAWTVIGAGTATWEEPKNLMRPAAREKSRKEVRKVCSTADELRREPVACINARTGCWGCA